MFVIAGLPAELVVHEDGEIHVHARHSDGAALGVSLPGQDGAHHSVALHYADAIQGHLGRLESTAPAVGPAEVLHVRRSRSETVEVHPRWLPRPAHRGSIVAVGEHVAEVVVRSDGAARVYGLPPEREVIVVVPSTRGGAHPFTLRYVASERCYEGRLEGASPQPGALQVLLQDGEIAGRGTLSRIDTVSIPTEAELPDVLPELRLAEPELGRDLPAVIPIP